MIFVPLGFLLDLVQQLQCIVVQPFFKQDPRLHNLVEQPVIAVLILTQRQQNVEQRFVEIGYGDVEARRSEPFLITLFQLLRRDDRLLADHVEQYDIIGGLASRPKDPFFTLGHRVDEKDQ